jgi:hypothetical protein
VKVGFNVPTPSVLPTAPSGQEEGATAGSWEKINSSNLASTVQAKEVQTTPLCPEKVASTAKPHASLVPHFLGPYPKNPPAPSLARGRKSRNVTIERSPLEKYMPISAPKQLRTRFHAGNATKMQTRGNIPMAPSLVGPATKSEKEIADPPPTESSDPVAVNFPKTFDIIRMRAELEKLHNASDNCASLLEGLAGQLSELAKFPEKHGQVEACEKKLNSIIDTFVECKSSLEKIDGEIEEKRVPDLTSDVVDSLLQKVLDFKAMFEASGVETETAKLMAVIAELTIPASKISQRQDMPVGVHL